MYLLVGFIYLFFKLILLVLSIFAKKLCPKQSTLHNCSWLHFSAKEQLFFMKCFHDFSWFFNNSLVVRYFWINTNFKVVLLPSKKFAFIFFNESPFFLEIYFFPDFLVEQLHKKAMVNFKIYDVTDWNTSNCNTHIAQ